MKTLEDYRSYGQDLYDKLHLSTYPLSIKYIESVDEIPEGAMRPSAMGQKMALCQAFAQARSWGMTVALTSDDNFCLPSTVLHKWVDISMEDLIESQVRQGWHKDVEAEKEKFKILSERLEYQDSTKWGKHIGLVCSPLNETTIIPDSVLIYCDGVQFTHIVQALSYEYKYVPTSSFEGFGESCTKGGLIPFASQQPQVVIPGAGDRMLGACSEHEIGLGLPAFLLFYMMDNLFKSGSIMNMGFPMRKMIPTGLPQDATPGFAYLLEKMNEKKE